MDELFFALLRDALWHHGKEIPKSLTPEELSEFIKFAKKQAVAGLVLDAITRNNIDIPKKALFEIIGLQEQIRHQSRRTNLGVVALHKLLTVNQNLDDNAKVEYVIVKGQAVASYYPAPLLRQSGDIDFYCKGENLEKTLQVVRDKWNVNAGIHGSEKHVDFRHDDNIYEGHFILTDLLSKERNDYFQQVIDNDEGTTVEIDGELIKTLSPTAHVLFVFLHLWYHLMALGVGLRHFCDLAVMLRGNVNISDNHDENDKRNVCLDELRRHLKALGIEKVYKACGSVLVDYLGLSEKEVGYNLSDTDRKYGKRIFDIVMYRGNLGHYEMVHGEWLSVHGSVKSSKIAEAKRKLEALGIKLSHLWKFWPLAPSYTCSWFLHEVKRSL